MATQIKKQKILIEPYLSKINDLRKEISFKLFVNGKPYSFDYHLIKEFQIIEDEIETIITNDPHTMLSPSVKKLIPIFLPKTARRIAFFEHSAKSVRVFNTDKIEDSLRRQAQKQYRLGMLKKSEIEPLVKKELTLFKTIDEENKQMGTVSYRHDLFTKTIQFNAYDKNDLLLIEKSYIRGGLIFNMTEEEFNEKVIVSYSRHRKQRCDKKNNYLPLSLLKIRAYFTAT